MNAKYYMNQEDDQLQIVLEAPYKHTNGHLLSGVLSAALLFYLGYHLYQGDSRYKTLILTPLLLSGMMFVTMRRMNKATANQITRVALHRD